MLNTKCTFTEKSEKQSTIRALRDLTGKIAKLSSLEPMILQFLDTLLSTQLAWGYGNHFLLMNLTFLHLIEDSTIMLLRLGSGQSISLVFSILMTLLKLAKNCGSSSNISLFQPQSRIFSEGIEAMQKKLVKSINGPAYL